MVIKSTLVGLEARVGEVPNFVVVLSRMASKNDLGTAACTNLDLAEGCTLFAVY